MKKVAHLQIITRWEKNMFLQLVVNFTSFRGNSYEKKIAHLKNIRKESLHFVY